jgi:hypothetical protein
VVVLSFVSPGAQVRLRIPGGATQTNGHWGRVKEFCDIANEYDVGVALVMFNTFGDHIPPGGAFATIDGTVPSPRIQIPSGATSHLDVYLEPSMGADGNPVIGKYDKATLWVGHPDVLESTGFVREMAALFRHSMTWLDGSSGGNNADFVHDYLDKMNAAGVTQSPGLAEIQVFNEPEAVHPPVELPPGSGNFWMFGVRWGDVSLRIFKHVGLGLNTNNPHSVPRHLSVKGPRGLAFRNTDGTYDAFDSLNQGFDDGAPTPPIQDVHHFNLHTTVDPYVYDEANNGRDATRVRAQWDYAKSENGTVLQSVVADLRNHTVLGTRGQGVAWKRTVAEETNCRAGTLQLGTDLATYTVNHLDPTQNYRMGLFTWAHHTSDAPKADFGPFILPCGFEISPYETEAFNDNWRAVSQANPSAGQTGVEPLDTGMSDTVEVALAESTDGKVMLVVYADNYSPKTSHSIDSNRGSYGRENHVYYRVRYKDGNQVWQWWPALNLAPADVDQSPGPLLFDEGRKALTGDSKQTGLLAGHIDNLYHSVANLAQPQPPFPPFGDYNLVEHSDFSSFGFLPYLRADCLVRQKRRNADSKLAPSVVFQKKAGNAYRFYIAWSRPTPKTAMNNGEPYFPEEDVPAQRYFVPFKNSITPSGGQNEYWKYEVLTKHVTVDLTQPNNPTVTPSSTRTMRTRGEVAETTPTVPGGGSQGNMNSTTLAAGAAGAAAMNPRLFVDPDKGHMVLVFMKSQDSWFDINTNHPGGLTPTNVQTWESSSAWHVYPWELFAMPFVETGDANTFAGDWVPASGQIYEGDWRVNRPYPRGGIAGWLDDTRYQLVYKSGTTQVNHAPSLKSMAMAEFFPAVDPYAVVWNESSNATLRFAVAFKELNTWIDPTSWQVPFGYETVVATFSVPIPISSSSYTALNAPTRSRVRVPFLPTMPVEEGTSVPPDYASYEAKYDMNEAPIVRSPDFGGLGVTVMAQHGQRVAMNYDGYDPATQIERVITASANQFMTGQTRVFSSSFKAAGVVRATGTDDVFTSAWLYHKPPPGGNDVNPEVELWIWGRVGSLLASAAQVYRVTSANSEGADFQARVVSLEPAGTDGSNRQQFALTWQQSGRLFRLVYVLDKTPGGQIDFPTIAPGSATTVAGVPNMFNTGNGPYLHSGKTKAAAALNGVLWSIKGSVNFREF